MDISSVAGSLAAGTVGGSIDVGVINAVENLSQIQTSVLFSSIGIGAGVDAYA